MPALVIITSYFQKNPFLATYCISLFSWHSLLQGYSSYSEQNSDKIWRKTAWKLTQHFHRLLLRWCYLTLCFLLVCTSTGWWCTDATLLVSWFALPQTAATLLVSWACRPQSPQNCITRFPSSFIYHHSPAFMVSCCLLAGFCSSMRPQGKTCLPSICLHTTSLEP